MRNPIDTLRDEHEKILSVVSVLEAVARSTTDGRLPDEYVERVLDFVRIYIDGNHHAKEEGALFPAMASDPWLSRLADVLTYDHEDGRMLVAAIERASLEGRPVARPILEFVAYLRDHIRREDEAIFETVEHSLGASTLAELDERFQQIEDDVLGPDGERRLFERILSAYESLPR